MLSIHLLVLNNQIAMTDFTLKLQEKMSYINIILCLSHWTHIRMKSLEERVSLAVVHATTYFLPKSQDNKILKDKITLRRGTGLRNEESFL